MTPAAAPLGARAATAAAPEPRGVHLVNSRGVPGTAGALLEDASGRATVLTTRHVAYGRGAVEGDVLWARVDSLRARFEHAGRVAGGHVGRVPHGDVPVFVDWAAVAVDLDALSRELGDALRALPGPPAATTALGMPVTKLGAATGWTEGVVADVAHYDRPFLDGRAHEAPGQILVAPAREGELFSAPGDSGAVLVDAAGRIAGLLWGCSASGDGIACPIEPVLACLGSAGGRA